MSQIRKFRTRGKKIDLARKLNPVVWVLSIAVLGLVVVMRQWKIPLPEGVDLSFLPPFHAILNGLAASFLVLALFAIKAGKVESHRMWIFLALGCSIKNSNIDSSIVILFTVGFCGGFTTFSSFSHENLTLINNNQLTYLFVYVFSSILVGIFSVFLGLRISKYL